jgi:hypothetical protein
VWLGPPDNVLGVSVPVEPLLLARTDAVAVSLGGFLAYPTGMEFTLAARRRLLEEEDDWFGQQLHLRHRRGREVPPAFLRFGVEFSDGRKATNVGGWHVRFDPREEPPDEPVLIDRGGGGGGTRFDQGYWLWPLPPPGRLGFVTEWPSEGVALTRVDVDAAAILEASARATTLWEPAGAGAGGGNVGQVRIAEHAVAAEAKPDEELSI